jgi:hypothetical protein
MILINDKLRDQLYIQLDKQLWNLINIKLYGPQLYNQLRTQLDDNTYKKLDKFLWDQLWERLRIPIDLQLIIQLDTPIDEQLKNNFI